MGALSHGAALPVLAATGMAAEARIARGGGVVALAGGGDAARLALMLQAALERGAVAVISFGIAGGLAPGLRHGTTVLASGVVHDGTRLPADPGWAERLGAALPGAVTGDLAGVDQVVAGPAGKRSLHDLTGALAVDMESHIAARLAARYGVPFAALRVIADPAERALPEAATVGMRPDGGTDVGAVMRVLARKPGELPGLIRTALDAGAAFSALRRARRSLGPNLGFDAAAVAGVTLPADRPRIDLDIFGAGAAPDVQAAENG